MFTFRPYWGKSFQLSVATTSGSASFPAGAGALRVANTGSTTAYVTLGRGSATADTVVCMAIPGNAVETYSNPDGLDTVAAIVASGSTILNVTPGEGL